MSLGTADTSVRATWWRTLQRALNHPNFGLPVDDLESLAFGQILQAAPPRLLQLAIKFVF